jgi:hypothetical protein
MFFPGPPGIFSVSLNQFTVSGPRGGVLTGTGVMQAVASGSLSTYTLNLTGPVSVAPTGAMTFTPGPGSTVSNASNTGTITGGSLTSH